MRESRKVHGRPSCRLRVRPLILIGEGPKQWEETQFAGYKGNVPIQVLNGLDPQERKAGRSRIPLYLLG